MSRFISTSDRMHAGEMLSKTKPSYSWSDPSYHSAKPAGVVSASSVPSQGMAAHLLCAN